MNTKMLMYTLQCSSGWNCQPWPSRSQNWMFVHSIIILSRSQQFPTSSSQNQVELGEWATSHFMHWCSAKIFCIMHLFNIIMEDNSEVTKC